MKTVLILLSSDQFSLPLINYLDQESKKQRWKICVGSLLDNTIVERLKQERFSNNVVLSGFTNFAQCDQAIRKADLVIGLLNDNLLLKATDSCLLHGKAMITPARLSRPMSLRRSQAEENETLLLVECGFSPGLDHITAKKAIDNIHAKGGKITSFKTYHGSFADPNLANNPLHYKITESTVDLINFGKQNNRYLINQQPRHIPYHRLFDFAEPVEIPGLGRVISVPGGDSLYYKKIYQLTECETVIKGKLFPQGFDSFWKLLIDIGLTDSSAKIAPADAMSFYQFTNSFFLNAGKSLEENLTNAGATEDDIEKMRWLGLFSSHWIDNNKELSAASVLHYLLEEKCSSSENDTDRVILQHQLDYEYRNHRYKFIATLEVNGTCHKHTAMAKTIGLTLGTAAKSYLEGNISLKGLQLPTTREIYDPILNELYELGITFHVDEKPVYDDTLLSEITQPVRVPVPTRPRT